MAKRQLIIFHFAGGNCHSFQFLTPLLKEFDVFTPELPGRGRRMGEPLLREFPDAVRDMYDQVCRRTTDTEVILYGHSLGSYLAFGVADLLEKAGRPASCLLVSGNPGPGVREPKYRYLMPKELFMEELRQLGGIPEEFLHDKDLIDFFEPILRADFELAERNDLAAAGAVNTPIYAMMGTREDQVELLHNWKRFTRGAFDQETMEGDHFFIYDHAHRIADILRSCHERTAAVKKSNLFQTQNHTF